jgi:hypothetical protein
LAPVTPVNESIFSAGPGVKGFRHPDIPQVGNVPVAFRLKTANPALIPSSRERWKCVERTNRAGNGGLTRSLESFGHGKSASATGGVSEWLSL